jgi:hypothetical protein
MANLFCNVLVKLGEGAVEAERGAIRELDAFSFQVCFDGFAAPAMSSSGL